MQGKAGNGGIGDPTLAAQPRICASLGPTRNDIMQEMAAHGKSLPQEIHGPRAQDTPCP